MTHKPDERSRRFVRNLVAAGSTINSIANAINITDDTLRKHYDYEIKVAREVIKSKAVSVVFNHLDDNNLDAAKYVLARVAGWKEGVDVTSGDKPIEAFTGFVLTDLQAEDGE